MSVMIRRYYTLVDQNFEGVGYDNGETWLDYAGDTGTIDPDYAVSPLRGSQSLRATDDDDEGTYAVTKFSDDTGINTLYGFLRIKFISYPSGVLGDYEFMQTYNCQGPLVAVPEELESHEMLFINAGIVYVNHGAGGFELGHGTHVIELDTVHFIWFYITRSAGLSSGWVRIGHTLSFPGENDIAWTNVDISGQYNHLGTNAVGLTTFHGTGIEYVADQFMIDVNPLTTPLV